jgi:uncharacterized OB-fold protein
MTRAQGCPQEEEPTRLTAPFWRAARERRLLLQRCPECGMLRWPPRPICPTCWRPAEDDDWTEVGQMGEIWSFVVYHKAFDPIFSDKIPYNVTCVKLDAGPIFISNVVDGNDLMIGSRVTAFFDDVSSDLTLVKFQLIG